MLNHCSKPRIVFWKLDITGVVLEAIIADTIITGQGTAASLSHVENESAW